MHKDIMVIAEPHIQENQDVASVVSAIHRNYFFLDEKSASKNKSKVYVVSARKASAKKPDPIRWGDFIDDTINPIWGKAKLLFGGKAADPQFVKMQIDEKGRRIVFIFVAAGQANKRK